MRTGPVLKSAFAAAAACLLAGCATSPISSSLRQEARKDLSFEQAVKDPNACKGALVIWGGYIVEVANTPAYTEVTVLDTPLGSADNPDPAETSPGRFLARINKFLDPAVYRKGRKVTVAGRLTGQETRPLGKIDYAYPVLETEELHMWERERAYQDNPMFDFGFWYGPVFFDEHEGREHRR